MIRIFHLFLVQLPDLHRLTVEAAQILNIEAPDLYVCQNPAPNAYTLAISGRKPFVVVHTSLIELLTPKEFQVLYFTRLTADFMLIMIFFDA